MAAPSLFDFLPRYSDARVAVVTNVSTNYVDIRRVVRVHVEATVRSPKGFRFQRNGSFHFMRDAEQQQHPSLPLRCFFGGIILLVVGDGWPT
jgi:hypothetical protein